MAQLIRKYENRNLPIIPGNTGILPLTYFNLLRLSEGETLDQRVEGFETVYVVLKGACNIKTEEDSFTNVGWRQDIWSGNADSVYIPSGAWVHVHAIQNTTEIAVAGGKCEQTFKPFRIYPEDEEMVDVGSSETHSRRRIYHILGHNAKGRAGNLLVSELFADQGCWAGYPPHKHDEEQGEKETAFEEAYHYRFRPEAGFGAQLVFQPDGSAQGFMTRDGDTLLIDKGYHPTVTSPGHEEYIFTILVGRNQRSLIQNFKEDYRYLVDKIPGIGEMRAKFK